MKAPNPRVVLPVLLSFFTSVTFAAGGTRPVTTEAVESAVAAARGQIQALEESGEDPNVEAVRTSLAALWELGREQPDSVAGERATSEALSLLIRIGRVDEAAAKAAALGPDESAWDPLLEGLLGAAREVGRYEAFEKAASARLALLQARPDQQARLWFVLGRIHLAQDRRDEARQAFERVVAADSRAPVAASAQKILLQLDELAPGRAAPVFAGTTLSGERVDLEKLRGGAVLVAVWASW